MQTLFNRTLADQLVNQKGGLNLTTGMTKKKKGRRRRKQGSDSYRNNKAV